MLSQLRSTGEINISSYAKHLSSRHDLALSSVEQYVYLHDTVAAAIGKLSFTTWNHTWGIFDFLNTNINQNVENL